MRVEPSGPVPCDLAIFGEAPGYEEQMAGEGFVGKAGQELWAGMKRFCGMSREDFYISNLIKEGLPKNRDPKPAEVADALPEFLDEIERVQPRIVIAAGAFSTKAILGNVKMADVHGIPHHADIAGHEFICMPIYHPAAGLHNKGFLAAFAYDLGRTSALLRGELKPWVPARPPKAVEWLTGLDTDVWEPRGNVVALDTEGWPEKPWGLSFSLDGKEGYVIPTDNRPMLDWFADWIIGKTVVMHNGIHDLPVLRGMGVHIDGFHDTQVLAYHDIIRTGSGVLEAESQNLGTLAYRYCGLRLRELTDCAGVDYSTQTIPYTGEVMQYAGMDAIATRRLFDHYRPLTETQAYQIDMGQVPLVERMIDTGIPFDLDATMDYYADVLDKLETVTSDLRSKAARLGNRDFNPGSHPQVRELLTRRIGLRIRKRTKGGKASTNEKALADHRDHPFVEALQSRRELDKLRGTYLVPLIEELSQ